MKIYRIGDLNMTIKRKIKKEKYESNIESGDIKDFFVFYGRPLLLS